jgi:membrane protease YdiL (CAAX protease family)
LSIAEAILNFVIVAIAAGILLLANQAQRTQNNRYHQVVAGILMLFNLLFVLAYGPLVLAEAYGIVESASFSKMEAWGSASIAVLFFILATAALFRPVRERIAILFPRYREEDKEKREQPVPSWQSDGQGTPLYPQMLNYYQTGMIYPTAPVQPMPQPDNRASWIRGFNPASTVHMVALVYVQYLLGNQFVNFVLGGGLEGVAESYDQAFTVWSLLVNSMPLLIIPVIGVGMGVRRGWSGTFRRLGLNIPTLEGLGMSVALTIGLLIFIVAVSIVWQMMVSPETFDEQTKASNALSDSVNTIGVAFVLAATAAISEEIAFRGALQPVLGYWPTALVFAALHSQYTLTPAFLTILGVALVFGWIRMRYGTTVAIMTHFLYNFIQLGTLTLMTEEAIFHLLF